MTPFEYLSQFDIQWNANSGEFSDDFFAALDYVQMTSLWSGFIVMNSAKYKNIEDKLIKLLKNNLRPYALTDFVNFGLVHGFGSIPILFPIFEKSILNQD